MCISKKSYKLRYRNWHLILLIEIRKLLGKIYMNQLELIELFIGSQAPDQRRNAAEVLASNSDFDSDSAELLVNALSDEDIGVRDTVFRLLQSRTNHQAKLVNEYLVKLILDNDIEIRNLAAEILKITGIYSPELLIPYLNIEDIHIRQFTVDICSAINDNLILEELKKLFTVEKVTNVKTSLIEALGNFHDEEAEALLIQQFNIESDLKPVIIDALAKYQTTVSEEFIIKVLKSDDDVFIRIACLDALSAFSMNEEIIEFLKHVIFVFPEQIQMLVLKSIVLISERIGHPIDYDTSFYPIAAEALKDDDDMTVYSGIKVLWLHIGEQHIPDLAFAILRESPIIMRTALELILILNNEDILRLLVNNIIDKSYNQGSIQNLLSLLPSALSILNSTESSINFQNVLFELMLSYTIEPSVHNIDSIMALDPLNFKILIKKHYDELPEEVKQII